MKCFRWLIVGLFFILIVAACNRESRSEGRDEVVFEVDPTRIGGRVSAVDLGVVFHPPMAWEPVTDEVMAQVSAGLDPGQDRSEFAVEPAYVFLHETSMSVLIISRIEVRPDSMTQETFLDLYSSAVEELQSTAHIQSDIFHKGRIQFHQYLIQDETKVVFKLLFQSLNHVWVQYDYITMREQYPEEVKAIESSIGSIQILGKEGGADD